MLFGIDLEEWLIQLKLGVVHRNALGVIFSNESPNY
jgi:hypothetical protein